LCVALSYSYLFNLLDYVLFDLRLFVYLYHFYSYEHTLTNTNTLLGMCSTVCCGG